MLVLYYANEEKYNGDYGIYATTIEEVSNEHEAQHFLDMWSNEAVWDLIDCYNLDNFYDEDETPGYCVGYVITTNFTKEEAEKELDKLGFEDFRAKYCDMNNLIEF